MLRTGLHRFAFAIAVIAMTAIGAIGAIAAERHANEPEAFRKAQAHGASILVDVAAPWCPACQRQRPIIGRITEEPRFRDLVIFHLDFDSQKDALRNLNARSQGTLIAFNGE